MKILLTGGSGFLGRGIMTYWPENEYIVYSRDEYKQDMARRVLSKIDTSKQWILGDIRDLDRLTWAMRGVDLVIHTAAIKYIPEAEFNVDECVKVNVDGSRNVITAAIRAGVNRVIGISTDKAVQPLNTYGMTKALMERLFVEANNYGNTIFTLTRYGNVVGSTGSVFTVFEHQLETQGTLTLTDPTMTRYWQSISQSVELIRIAAQVSGGLTVIPRGASMSMGKLAQYLIAYRYPKYLSPSDHIQIVGIRPGEKMHESLIGGAEIPRIQTLKGSANTVDAKSDVYLLHPVGTHPPKDVSIHPDATFSSERPDRMVVWTDMDDMIREAQIVGYGALSTKIEAKV